MAARGGAAAASAVSKLGRPKARVKLRIAAGEAKPSPAIGQALGSLGINMMEFCKAFNEKSTHLTPGVVARCALRAYDHQQYEFTVMTPPASWFLKKAAGVAKGTPQPGHMGVGSVHVKQIYEIAKIKATDPNLEKLPLNLVAKSIVAQCTSLGLTVRSGRRDHDAPPELLDAVEVKVDEDEGGFLMDQNEEENAYKRERARRKLKRWSQIDPWVAAPEDAAAEPEQAK